MISVNVHTSDGVLENGIPLDQISDVLQRPGELLWVDVSEPTAADLALLRTEFSFHPLAMEDVSRHYQRPKVDLYDTHAFLVFYALRSSGDVGSTIALTQLGMFVGHNFVVTVHEGEIASLKETSDRWRRNVEQIGAHNVGMLVYSILDGIVDGYFPILDDISDRLDELEQRIFEKFDIEAQQEIFRIKKGLVSIRRVIAPERDVMNVLLRRDTPLFDASVIVYFQDVYDHILRVTDAVDTYRDLLSSALEYHLSITSNRLNQIMKTLTASSIILMSMTLVASVYGMNFVHIPELSWQFGYVWALGLMALICAALIKLFRRIDWF